MCQFRWSALIALLGGTLLLLLEHTEYVEGHKLLAGAAHEVGFAMIVAVVVWLCFEFFSQSESEKRWLNRIEVISRNVFVGVFRRNLPEKFIDEVSLLLLDHKFIRTSINITYTMSDRQYVDRRNQAQKFVCLHASMRLKTRCVSESPHDLLIVLALPNPLIEEMKPWCRVERVVFRQGETVEVINLEHAEKAFRDRMRNDEEPACRFDLGTGGCRQVPTWRSPGTTPWPRKRRTRRSSRP